ncbi:hypothetical protein MHU86_2469 [Fragilaria crotonensis]|nr:hypothetical protein MHU86_2469 [Fragilaria crotonensis]
MCPNGGTQNLQSAECQAIAEDVQSAEIGSDACKAAQSLAQGECCEYNLSPPPLQANRCSLCAEGDEPTGNMTQVIYGDTTCNDLQASASVISNSSDSCYLLQLQGVRLCGCKSQKLRKCNLCAGSDDSPPFPDRVASSDGQTCGDLHQSVSESNDMCATIQVKGYYQCGCQKLPNLYVEPCSLCFDPAHPDDFIDNTFANQTNYRCSDAALDIFASGDGSKECLRNQAQAVLDCGCEKSPPTPLEPTCTLCPGGFEPAFPDQEIPDFPGLTCAAYEKLVPTLFDGSKCNREDLKSFRALCGCPKEAVCRLCNDGDDVVDESKTVVGENGDTHSCGRLADAAQYIKLGASIRDFQDQCQSYRDGYSSQCCPGSSVEALTFDFPTSAPTLTATPSIVNRTISDSLESMSAASSFTTSFTFVAMVSYTLMCVAS